MALWRPPGNASVTEYPAIHSFSERLPFQRWIHSDALPPAYPSPPHIPGYSTLPDGASAAPSDRLDVASRHQLHNTPSPPRNPVAPPHRAQLARIRNQLWGYAAVTLPKPKRHVSPRSTTRPRRTERRK
ncbi:hypothetical protein C8R44DRAFT_441601 [Mycena epipterygia]|nr:hypothetical protein C8R44DRAFT_441601 [Mycena epipterygia]